MWIRTGWLQSPSLGIRVKLVFQIPPGMGLIALGPLIPNREMPATASNSKLEGKAESSLISASLHVPVLQPNRSLFLKPSVPVPITDRLCAMMTSICFCKWPLPWLHPKKSSESFLFELPLNSISLECPWIINNPISKGRISTCQVFLFSHVWLSQPF